MSTIDSTANTPRPKAVAPPWRRPSARSARLASGLVLMAFALTHFLNHAVGVFGLDAVEATQTWRSWIWRTIPGTILLYGALAIHIALGLARIVSRRSFRMPPLEAAQIVLGLMIPVWLTPHILGTRMNASFFGIQDSYFSVLRNLWPSLAAQQSLLLLVVWIHGCIGLFFVLRTRTWFARWRPALSAAAALVPVTALAGFVAIGREVAKLPDRPGLKGYTPAEYELALQVFQRADLVMYGAAGVLLMAVFARRGLMLVKRRVAISYAGGATIQSATGPTLLEMSRMNGVAHASVCGGRARCSTCRVRVLSSQSPLPAASPIERMVLDRIEAPPNVRLACQIRPVGDLSVQLLIPAAEARGFESGDTDPFRWGVERRVTVLFVDLRGFTSFSERQYPYDVVFLLNRFLGEMSRVVVANGGVVDKYLGDGLMALFGVTPQKGAGSAAALEAARGMFTALDQINLEFRHVAGRELRMGVGIHMGPAILGRIGASSQSGNLTALGDTVNTASRLEAATKEFNAELVVSEATMAASGLQFPGVDVREITVRGREQPLVVHVLATVNDKALAAA